MDKYRQVSELIYKVLTSDLSVSEALVKFPLSIDKDINLKCAFDALMHYEADEDLRKDKDYAKMQDDYMEFIAATLFKHESLPVDIVKRYYKYHKDNLLFGNKKGFRGFIEYIKRIINF